MKKIIFLCVLLLLGSCTIDWNGEKDKKIAELEKQNLTGSINENISSQNTLENLQTSTGSKNDYLLNLKNISIYSISGSILDKNEFYDFIKGIYNNNYNKNEFIGKKEDWIKAFKTSCSNKTVNIAIYNWLAFGFEPLHTLDLNRVCRKSNKDDLLIKKLFDFLDDNNKYTLNDFQFNNDSLRSNLKSYEGNPITPIEKLISTQIFYGMEIERFIIADLYKNQIVVIYASSQEDGLPYYHIMRIYMENNKLFAIKIDLDFTKELNLNYGDGFTEKLYNNSFYINNSFIDESIREKDYSKEEINLLKGNWVDSPSIINLKLEDKIKKDFLEIIRK